MGKTSTVIFSIAFLLTVVSSCDFHEKDLASEENRWDLYERWRSHHTVSRDLAEKHKRFNVFKENVRFIHFFNKWDAPYKLKLNKYGDMTIHEFSSTYGSFKVNHHRALQGRSRRGNRNLMVESANDILLLIGGRKASLPVSRTKDNVGVVGLSLQQLQLRA